MLCTSPTVSRWMKQKIKKTKTKTWLKAVFRPSRFDLVWSSIMNHGAVSSFQIVSLLNKPISRSYSKRELLRLILTHKFSNRQSRHTRRAQLLPRCFQGSTDLKYFSPFENVKCRSKSKEIIGWWGAGCHWLLMIFSLYFRLFVDN